MNIVVFSWRGPKHPLAGGAEQVMHEHMKGWLAAGHSVTLFTSSFAGAKRVEIIDGVRILRYGYELLGVHILAAFWYIFLCKKPIDLVVDQFHGIPFFTPLYSRVKKIAVVQEVARDVWLNNRLVWPIGTILGYIGYYTEPIYYWFYKGVTVIVGSESAKSDLQTVGISQKQIVVIPHGVILIEQDKKSSKEKKKTVIFLGALAKDKGVEDAIEAFGLISKKIDTQFWIVGKGSDEYVSELKRKVKLFGIEKKTTFWGFVSQSEKFNLLSKAHLLLNPSIREGWGLVNIEANAMETPVIAYRAPGLVDSVLHNKSGIICNRNTPKHLADESIKLLQNIKAYKRLQKGAYTWSKQFSWTQSRKLSLDLIERITQND